MTSSVLLHQSSIPKRWLFPAIMILLTGVYPFVSGAFVGFDIGTDMSKAPSPSDMVALLQSQQITHVRLYDANSQLLRALANTSIVVMVGVTNEEVLGIGQSPSVAASWVNKNILTYIPDTNITSIAVGSEVLSTIPHAARILAPAMNNIHSALLASNLNSQIKVSTPQSMDIISRPFPPSAATFNSTWNSTIHDVLQFLKTTDSYFMLNAYPYYGYMSGNGIFPLDYALFRQLSPMKQIVDPNTLYHYDSMFDAMVDAAYYSIASLNFSDIPVVVTETGWPSHGGSNEPDATSINAQTYNNNLIRRILNGSGPPSQPDMPINTYIYELYNEDLRRGPISEKNWGAFDSNGTSVYSLSLGNSSGGLGNGSFSGDYCIARTGADSDKLRDGLNWACGEGHANCSAIQEGHPCYYPDNLENHASYAYNDYYQRMRGAGGTCDFDGTATTTNSDPSYGSCLFTGSGGSVTGGGNVSTSLGPVSSPFEGSARMLLSGGGRCTILGFLVLLLCTF